MTRAIAYARLRGHRCIRYKQGPLAPIALDHDLPKISIQSSLGAPRTGACGVGDYPTPDLVPGSESEADLHRKKSKQFGPDGARSVKKTSITLGPQES